MEVLDMMDVSRGDAIGMPGIVGGAVPSVMVGRVLVAMAGTTGRAGLLEWIEAWGTAAVVDGRCRSIAVEGDDVVVVPGTRRGALSRIDDALTLAGTGSGVVDVAIIVLMDGGTPVVRIVVAGDHSNVDPVIRTIRLQPSNHKAPSMRREPMSRVAFPDEDALEPTGAAQPVHVGRATGLGGGQPWA